LLKLLVPELLVRRSHRLQKSLGYELGIDRNVTLVRQVDQHVGRPQLAGGLLNERNVLAHSRKFHNPAKLDFPPPPPYWTRFQGVDQLFGGGPQLFVSLLQTQDILGERSISAFALAFQVTNVRLELVDVG